MACPGLTTHTLAGLCALWIPSYTLPRGKLQYSSAKLHPPQTTYLVRPQHPVQAPSHLLITAETFILATAHGIPRAGHSHTGRALLCAVVAELRLHNWKAPAAFSKTACSTPNKPPGRIGRSTQCRPHHTWCTLQRLYLTLQWHLHQIDTQLD